MNSINVNWYIKNASIEEPFGDREGKCYELSGRYVWKTPGSDLIHGKITNKLGDGKTINHAWIEIGNFVIDPILNKRFQREYYYKIYAAEPIVRFSTEEIVDLLMKNKHWGPWDGSVSPKTPEYKEDNNELV